MLKLHALQGNAGDDLSVVNHVKGVLPGGGEAQAGDVENEILAPEKGRGGWFGHVELNLRAALGQDRLAVLVDEGDLDDVLALVPGAEEQPQGDGAVGMDGGVLPGADGVERAQDAELALVVASRIGD